MRRGRSRYQREAIKVSEAQARIHPYVRAGQTETISLHESHGRYLAEDIYANEHLPHFRRSGMDGFAIRSEDTQGASREQPVLLEVQETVPCGSVPNLPVTSGKATRIMTGAAVPDGADAVIMIEMTTSIEKDGKNYIAISREIEAGQNILPIGDEVTKGTLLLQKGQKINPGVAALLATFGYAKVKVYQQPKVAIFATGSELLDVDEALVPGRIRNSNGHMLAHLLLSAGAKPILHTKLPDNVKQAKKAIIRAFDEADLVISTGGVSVGDYDILVDIFEQWDGQMLFNKVAMRPGSPTTVGVYRDQFLFSLSGNPGACFVGFELFVRPTLWGMQGKSNLELPTFTATLLEDFSKPSPFERYVRGVTSYQDGKVYVKPAGVEKSSVTLTIKDADCLIIIPSGGRGASAGDLVKAISLKE
ncbi:molybdopterin molybdotransferase MoeA [Thermoflavimicrobium dichotomicum]|uniref:Molybdopterin molybdenumtransferase n=1 Tax=Thermoflavimicrobium dichotomicum TaxID=46223 RepID=A0A1I3SXK0_9BACL|nr:gephyrin-like molybdotransferase Glp [Thermoflavimicrobium dichotomicum]SFJ62589.1 molybdopterin molybdotransferase [Thermoflavimicrobium dichotomicum]